MKNFNELGLAEPLLKAISEMNFTQPTAIQQEAIPILHSGNTDFIGLAQTGTGKTAAFGLPLLTAIDPDMRTPQAVILAPTRELAQQISVQLEAFSKYLRKIRIATIYGGAPITKQIRELKAQPQIVVATPGRLIDMIKRKAVDLSEIKVVVLDEADEMLNMGFKEEMDQILAETPQDKLTWLFSATMPAEIRKLVKRYMHDPKEVAVSTGNQVNINIDHEYLVLKSTAKGDVLKYFLLADPSMRAIIFCRTKRQTQELADELLQFGFDAEPIHGDLNQSQRDRVMLKFKQHKLQVLVATDVAARGIDVNDLTHVIHHTLPDDEAYYTHRSGRTARAGKMGISLALITQREKSKIAFLEKKLGIQFRKVERPNAAAVNIQMAEAWATELLNDTAERKMDMKAFQAAKERLADLSKDDLIERLLAREFAKHPDIEASGPNREERRERARDAARDKKSRPERGDRRERSDRKERREKRERVSAKDRPSRREKEDVADRNFDSADSERFFINLGKIDKVKKRDLVQFISEQAKIPVSDVGNVSLQDKHAYFEVHKKHSSRVASSFKNFQVNGRKLRVNRDN